MAGPLEGIRIIEFGGIGPAPFAGMMLADHGAEVIRIDRPGTRLNPFDPLLRSRKSVLLDLKSPRDCDQVRALCRDADGLIEGFRPGVMERLGLGPNELLKENPQLVYGRMTGWGQNGPQAALAGHDIDYIAISGALGTIGPADGPPVVPLNLVGDFGGGGMMLAFGMLAALLSIRDGGQGQVIDCAMTDGSALLMSIIYGWRHDGRWRDRREDNVIDGGAPYYGTYATADGQHVAIGAIEPQFYAILREKLGILDDPAYDEQEDPLLWPKQREGLRAIFRTRTRAQWCEILEATDACFAPVLDIAEALHHPHNVSRETFIEVAGVVQPAPAPRYSLTPCSPPRPAPEAGADSQALLGMSEA